MVNFSILEGKILKEVSIVKEDPEKIIFVTESGETYRLIHYQDCCEHVYVEDVNGDLHDLLGTPILKAEERTNSDYIIDDRYDGDEARLWSFYHLRTAKGDVTMRWYGGSNGYYGVSVTFEQIDNGYHST